MERKHITTATMEDKALKPLSNNESGADFGVLQTLAKLVVDGKGIDSDFQKVANAIVAQAVFFPPDFHSKTVGPCEWSQMRAFMDKELKKEAISQSAEPQKSGYAVFLEESVAWREKGGPILKLHSMIEEVLRQKFLTDIR